jgi:hypothetical protein
MDLQSPVLPARGSERPTLHTRDEQAENGFARHQTAAMRQASVKSASTSARQTIFTEALSRLSSERLVAAANVKAGLLIPYAILSAPLNSGGNDKGPGIAEAFGVLAYIAYFSEVEIPSNLVFRVLPMPLTAVMITIEIPAAIRPYSMAVAPDSSLRKREIRFFIR